MDRMERLVHLEDIGVIRVQLEDDNRQREKGQNRCACYDRGGLFNVDVLLLRHAILALHRSNRRAENDRDCSCRVEAQPVTHESSQNRH